jgi:pimeloyl-ACP methyl ester carboxylesterase
MSDPVPLAASALDGPDGAPVLVLGNSLGTSRDCWGPSVPVLARHFRLLRYEHRGHGVPPGQSPAPPGPYALSDLGRDVLALLDARGVRRALYCGVSLGGMIGMWLAAHAPDRIAGLGLSCTSAYLPPAAGWTQRAAAGGRHRVHRGADGEPLVHPGLPGRARRGARGVRGGPGRHG